MALTYTIVLAGAAARRRVITRLGFTRDRFDRSGEVWRGRFDELGLSIALESGRHGRFQCGPWEFNPDRYLCVEIELDAERLGTAVAHVAALTERVLETGEEPVAVIAFGAVMVLTREGTLRRHEATWPGLYPAEPVDPAVLAPVVEGLPHERGAVEALADTLIASATPLTRREAEAVVALGAATGADPARVTSVRALSSPAERVVFDAIVTQFHANTVVALDERVLEQGDATAQDWTLGWGPVLARAAARQLLEIAADPAHPLREPLNDTAWLHWFDGELGPLGHALAQRIGDRVQALTAAAEAAIVSAFTRSFNGDDTDDEDDAGIAAGQILQRCDRESALAAARWLRVAADHAADPLIGRVEAASGFDWSGDERARARFQAVAREIADQLEMEPLI
ncbi:hypothetical protein DVA67_031380 [Solirubrobacter sp. CPCC 204708]|uniref:DUF4192 family protein n=1 Tax=Solirubrobacter deserti TaxID=2282478 RepID=A0ABT4RQA1_9ACTN|nr:hypothetical protein [Solirubrobacter deserti]MBE2320507.1 hypothetical protein [Solirubrobacter deserti]MDA0140753.1 hypothetical protein [Solirubrobacter deserti]